MRAARRCLAGAVLLFSALCVAGAESVPPAQRIASLAPHLTELVFAVGAGERIVATVEYSDYPPAARQIPQVGNAFRVDLERLVASRPDLVLSWASGTPASIIDRVEALGLRHVAVRTANLADVPAALRQIGALTGRGAAAGRAASEFERQVAALRAEYAGRPPRTVFIEIDDQPLYTVNGRHVISEIVELCGGRNIFADLPQLAPPISIEAVLAADPEVILSTDDTVVDPLGHWGRWTQLRAVRERRVHTLPSDLVARATPRLIDGIRAVCARLE